MTQGTFEILHKPGTDPQDREQINRLLLAAPAMFEALVKSEQRIVQLCSTVNTYSNMLGYGDKVRAEHFADVSREAIAKAKGGQS